MNQNQFRQYTEKRGYRWCSLAVVLASVLALTGCDDKADESASSTDKAQNTQTTEQQNSAQKTPDTATQTSEKSAVTTKTNNETALKSKKFVMSWLCVLQEKMSLY